jgi:hypothetical protein
MHLNHLLRARPRAPHRRVGLALHRAAEGEEDALAIINLVVNRTLAELQLGVNPDGASLLDWEWPVNVLVAC